MEARVEALEQRIETLGTTLLAEMRAMLAQRQNHDEIDPGVQRDRRERDRAYDLMRRLEVPYFSDEDLYGWVYRAERYFEINQIPEGEKVIAASICLEGKALNWFQWWEARTERITWLMFRRALLGRFQSASSENPYEVLMSLRQRGTVMEYIEEFELVSAPLRHAEDEVLAGAFMNGLKEEVRAEVRLHHTGDLEAMMKRAKMVEERNRLIAHKDETPTKRIGSNFNRPALGSRWTGALDMGTRNEGGTEIHTNGPNNGLRGLPTGSHVTGGMGSGQREAQGSVASVNRPEGSGNTANRRNAPFRKLTEEEMEDRFRRRICFRCDEPLSPGHVCRNRQLRVLMLGEGERAGDDDKELAEEEEKHEEPVLRLNVGSVAGMTPKKSLKMWGTILGRKAVVLVDTGATHNFISNEVAQ